MSVITTAIAHDVSAQISLWLSDIVDDETRLKYLHGFVEMGVRAPPPLGFNVRVRRPQDMLAPAE